MKTVEVDVVIYAPLDQVWSVFTDIDNAEKYLSAITNIEMLDKPKSGVVGTKWRETRVMFGKEATEEMWISETDKPRSYVVSSDSHGMSYKTIFTFETIGNSVKATMSFGGKAVSLSAKLMQPMLVFMSGTLKKQLQADLDDLKKVCEQNE